MTPNHSEDTGDAMPNLKPPAGARSGYLLRGSASEGPC